MRSPRTTFGCLAALACGAATFAIAHETGVSHAIAALVAVNVVAFALYGLDKAIATWGPPHGAPSGHRVPEAVLLGIAALGGAPGAWAAMLTFRHKTRKGRFAWGVPALLALEGGVALWIVFRGA